MDIEKLREEIEYDEGSVNEIYLDHLGLATFGVGHLVRKEDPEYGWEVGTEVSNDRCVEAFNTDIETVLSDCKLLYSDFEDLPEEAQRIIANMMFSNNRWLIHDRTSFEDHDEEKLKRLLVRTWIRELN